MPGNKLKKSYIQANCVDILNVKRTICKNSMTGKKIYGYEINHNFDIDDMDDFKRLKKDYLICFYYYQRLYPPSKFIFSPTMLLLFSEQRKSTK